VRGINSCGIAIPCKDGEEAAFGLSERRALTIAFKLFHACASLPSCGEEVTELLGGANMCDWPIRLRLRGRLCCPRGSWRKDVRVAGEDAAEIDMCCGGGRDKPALMRYSGW
jgi:hypothetical protein